LNNGIPRTGHIAGILISSIFSVNILFLFFALCFALTNKEYSVLRIFFPPMPCLK